MTDLRPLPNPAPHGDILRFIYEKDEGMTGEPTGGGKQRDRGEHRFEKRGEQQQDRGWGWGLSRGHKIQSKEG